MAVEDGVIGSTDALTGGLLALFAGFFVFLVIFVLAIYVYNSLAWAAIGKKLKYKRPWLAWIPIANIAMIFQMGGFHWAWIFLAIIPIIGIIISMVFMVLGKLLLAYALMMLLVIIPAIACGVMLLIATWRIFEKRKYPGWLALSPLLSVIPFVGGFVATIAQLVIIGLVAWKNR